MSEKEYIQEEKLDEVTGGRTRYKREPVKNNVCPVCGEVVTGYTAKTVTGKGVVGVCMCHDCEVWWLADFNSSKPHEMVSTTADANGALTVLGPYQG